ncbi:cardiolipin synthase (CMP-forming)-like [Crassostrea virginica]
MLLRNVRTLTVNLCGLVEGSRSICCLNATKNQKKFDVCVLSSYNANFQTRRHSFINTFSYDKLFRRRFALTASHSCKRHDEIERDSGDKRAGENIITVPNLLTASRIISTPFLGYMVTHGHFEMALGLFIAAGITDLLDGYVARNFKNQMSSFGTFLDPLADKVMMTVMFTTLAMANIIPVALTVIVVGRDILLVGAGFYVKYISLKPPITFASFFDVTNASATLHPSTLSKYNTVLQLGLVSFVLVSQVMGWGDNSLMQSFYIITGCTTIGSGLQYMWNSKAYFKLKRR